MLQHWDERQVFEQQQGWQARAKSAGTLLTGVALLGLQAWNFVAPLW